MPSDAFSVETLALATLTLLLLGSAILCLLAALPSTAKVARAAFPILGTEYVIIGTVLAAFWLGGWVLSAALLALAARSLYEVLAVARPRAWRDWLALALFPGAVLALFTVAGLAGGYGAWLLLAFLLVETFDSYALLGGKLFGRRKAFPELSPNKTVEGLLTGAAMLIATAGLGAWALAAPVLPALGLAALTAPLAVAGDLLASRIKRRAGVKDYPQVLPRQGGVFDITDSWITVGAGFVLVALLTTA
jgi:phosphatidate cytidylyltransferase